MQFDNKENECVETVDGRKVFLSRSVAVIPVVICDVPGEGSYVLLNKRGPACPDHVGKWTLPCGYLDWNESGGQAAIREIWEECGFDVTKIVSEDLQTTDIGLLEDKPWEINSAPQEDPRQNVLLHYALRFTVGEPLPDPRCESGPPSNLPALHVDANKTAEVTAVGWIPVEEALVMKLAFDHQDRIAKYLDQ